MSIICPPEGPLDLYEYASRATAAELAFRMHHDDNMAMITAMITTMTSIINMTMINSPIPQHQHHHHHQAMTMI